MPDTIAVLNAGSSSVKFSVFVESGAELRLQVRGQIEGLFTRPRFVAKAADGSLMAEKDWGDSQSLGHDGALDHLIEFLRERGGGLTLAGVGHRVVHGGLEYAQPVRVDAQVLTALEKYVPLAPLHQPHNLAPIRALLERHEARDGAWRYETRVVAEPIGQFGAYRTTFRPAVTSATHAFRTVDPAAGSRA